MANFGKLPGKSTAGWDSKTGLQTLRVGQSVEIDLWGGGPSGEDLLVTPDDPSICTVHERPLRLNPSHSEVEFQVGSGGWTLATGAKGAVTAATLAFQRRDGQAPNLSTVVATVRAIFVDPKTGALRATTWEQNDFGRWGWNLRRKGQATAYFIHTTPDNEAQNTASAAVLLANSHGCVHIVPAERDRMIAAGYLKQGVDFEVRPYSEKGPP
jgi:hypothetical protein